MTREEAQKILATWLVSSKGAGGQRGYIEGWFDEDDAEAFRMAIEALNDAEYIKLLQEHINRQDIIIRKAIAKLKMGCTGCVHYDQQQTALICRDCKRYHKDMYKER